MTKQRQITWLWGWGTFLINVRLEKHQHAVNKLRWKTYVSGWMSRSHYREVKQSAHSAQTTPGQMCVMSRYPKLMKTKSTQGENQLRQQIKRFAKIYPGGRLMLIGFWKAALSWHRCRDGSHIGEVLQEALQIFCSLALGVTLYQTLTARCLWFLFLNFILWHRNRRK